MFSFENYIMKDYRDSVVHKKYGEDLHRAVKKIETKGYTVEGDRYARVPRGYNDGHKHAEFLLYRGLYAAYETKIPPELYTPKIVGYCLKAFRDILPLHQWLLALTERTIARRKHNIFLTPAEQKKFLMGEA